MKKTAWLVLAAMLLTGCQSVKTVPDTSSDPGDDEVQNLGIRSDTTWTWDSEELRNDVEKVYKQAIQDCFDGVTAQIKEEDEAALGKDEYAALQSATQEDGTPSYDPRNFVDVVASLFDIDKDNMPELVLTYGTMIDDKEIAIYTYDNGKLKTIIENLEAVRTYFAADTNTNEFVLVKGGGGEPTNIMWYTIENGELKQTKDSGEIVYAENENLSDKMKELGIAWTEFTEFYGRKTWKVTYPNGQYEMEETTDANGDNIRFDYSLFDSMLG